VTAVEHAKHTATNRVAVRCILRLWNSLDKLMIVATFLGVIIEHRADGLAQIRGTDP
jgi:hypothetical protein